MKQKISFVDATKTRVACEIEIKETEKGKEFSMSGDYGNSGGQVFDSVKPRTESQKKLIQIWKRWHLNGMNAGTEEQEELLKKCKDSDYDKQVAFLKKHKKYCVTLLNGEKYKYGTSWLMRKLPENFEEDLKKLLEEIKKEELTYKEEKINNASIKSFDDIDDPKIVALAKSLSLSPEEAEEIEEESDCMYSYEGIDYFIGDEEETHNRAIEYLTDDTYLYESWVEAQIKKGNASGVKNIDDWAEWVIEVDGYGQILNSWDGSEDYEDDYYIIRS